MGVMLQEYTGEAIRVESAPDGLVRASRVLVDLDDQEPNRRTNWMLRQMSRLDDRVTARAEKEQLAGHDAVRVRDFTENLFYMVLGSASQPVNMMRTIRAHRSFEAELVQTVFEQHPVMGLVTAEEIVTGLHPQDKVATARQVLEQAQLSVVDQSKP